MRWILLSILVTVVAHGATAAAAATAAAEPDIPSLEWGGARSDWIDVRTATPAAVGDGVTDDTAALQAAFARLDEGFLGPKTVYLPAGTYRITATLRLDRIGTMVVGDGVRTRIVWDGQAEAEARMIWSDGAPYARWMGFVLDGAGKAAIGIDHNAQARFETEIAHEHVAFRGFTVAAIRVGHEQKLASAEMVYADCLFERCARGIQLLTYNDYDNVIAGCEFRRCGVAVEFGHGVNGYIRDCRFIGSTEVDLAAQMPEHPCTIRRCVSIGSQRFLNWNPGVSTLTVEDCIVSGWKAADGAVRVGGWAVTMIDCLFRDPPSRVPPIHNQTEVLTLSGTTAPDSDAVADGNPAAAIIPDGALKGALAWPTPSFLKAKVDLPGKVFDAKRDFGAKGDDTGDDTAALQATIDAARAHGKGAIAYVPSGRYRVGTTITATGRDYVIGGGASGWHTCLEWSGAAGEPLLVLEDADQVRVERIGLGLDHVQVDSDDLVVRGAKTGAVELDHVWAWGTYAKDPAAKGIRLASLPKGATALLGHVTGNLHIVDCSRARVLIDVSWEGAMTVEGAKETVRDGFLGCLTRFNTSAPFGLIVRDNQSLTIGEYYVEQADHLWRFEGVKGQKPGRATIGGLKCHTLESDPIVVDGYAGQIAVIGLQFYCASGPRGLTGKGDGAFDLVLAGCLSYAGKDVSTSLGPKGRLTAVGNRWDAGGPQDEHAPAGLARVALALADLRRLGRLDLELNHPGHATPAK